MQVGNESLQEADKLLKLLAQDFARRHICVLILLYMCPHTAVYVSSYCYICVLILLYMCPHTALYVSSYCSICVLILLYMCHT